MELEELYKIPEKLPFSGKIGSTYLFKLKWEIEFLKELILKKRKKDPLSPQTNYMVADLSAKVWLINYIIETEKKLKKINAVLEMKEIYGNIIPEIPPGFKYKQKNRLKRLIHRVDYLEGQKKKKRKNLKTLEYDLEILFWVINHAVFLKEMENLQS